MTTQIGISNSTLLLNGETVSIIPNTLEFNAGGGEKTVRAISTGGGAVEMVVTENVETNKGSIKFSLATTPRSLRIISDVKELLGGNSVQIADRGLQISFSDMTLLADPMIPLVQDSAIELEFEGPPATGGGFF